jgi:hypothetical protein
MWRVAVRPSYILDAGFLKVNTASDIVTVSNLSSGELSDRLVCRPDGHLLRVTYTRYRIVTINSPDDERMSARNM